MFGAIGRAISRPVRGIGRIARGHVRKGLGDIGDGFKEAAPYAALIPGIGTAAAIGMGIGGGMVGRAGDKGANIGNVLGSGAKGGVAPAVGAALRGGAGKVGSKIPGMGGGAAGAAGAAPTPPAPGAMALPESATRMMAPQAVAEAGARSGVGQAVGDRVSEGIGGGVGGAAGRLGGWISDNPELAANIGGTAADVYAGHQAGRARDREFELTEEQYRERQRQRQEALDRIMNRRGEAY